MFKRFKQLVWLAWFAWFEWRVYVKPESLEPDTRWLVVVQSKPRAFLDDWRRYGLRAAWYNVTWKRPALWARHC